MGRLRVVFVALLVPLSASSAGGCAAGRDERRTPYLPYELASPPREPDEPIAAAPSGARGASVPPAVGSLEAPLARFAVEQRAERAGRVRGAPFPDSARARWSALLGAVDDYLRRPAAAPAALELIRARVTLDAELDFDADHYAELPAGLEASVRARTLALEQRLRLSRAFRGPSPSAPAAAAAAPAWLGELSWPVEPVFVTSLFGYRIDPLTGAERNHLGVDLRARQGQTVLAAGAGVVVRAGTTGGHGLLVELLHGDGRRTRYSHLSMALVTVGMRLARGTPVGLAGSTGRSTGPHLHFEVWRAGEPVDPLAELSEPEEPLVTAR